MTGLGLSHGAASVVNAMATGNGAAFGLAWKAKARVTASSRTAFRSNGRRMPSEDARLLRVCLDLVDRRAGASSPCTIDVTSSIPPKKGLKSSSAVSVATLAALARHRRVRLSDPEILSLAAEAGLRSGTSRTGAFDDAAACRLGGLVLTDNRRKTIISRAEIPRQLVALVHVPEASAPTGRFLTTNLRPIAERVADAFDLARLGRIREAMLANTLAYSEAFGWDPRFTFDALEAGAWAAGLSGKGPAEVALVPRQKAAELRRELPRTRRVEIFHGGAA